MSPETRLRLVEAARTCLGTPFHHQGRTPGVGLDCIGLVVVALRAVGFRVQDRQDYAPRPDGQSLEKALREHGFTPLPSGEPPQPGDVLLFRYDGQPQHVALATSPTALIHAFAPAGRVVETSLGASWRRRLVGRWRG